MERHRLAEVVGGQVDHLSLRFDPAGNPAIAYIDLTALKLARWSGTRWDVATVDPAAGSLQWDQLTLAFERGSPVIAYTSFRTVRFARWNGAGWRTEQVDAPAEMPSLAYDHSGQPFIAYHTSCKGDLKLATNVGAATLYRGVAISLMPGWKAGVLPLDSSSDDEAMPFPLSTSIPGAARDALPSGGPLTLFRVLWSGDREALNNLMAVKGGGGTDIVY